MASKRHVTSHTESRERSQNFEMIEGVKVLCYIDNFFVIGDSRAATKEVAEKLIESGEEIRLLGTQNGRPTGLRGRSSITTHGRNYR